MPTFILYFSKQHSFSAQAGSTCDPVAFRVTYQLPLNAHADSSSVSIAYGIFPASSLSVQSIPSVNLCLEFFFSFLICELIHVFIVVFNLSNVEDQMTPKYDVGQFLSTVIISSPTCNRLLDFILCQLFFYCLFTENDKFIIRGESESNYLRHSKSAVHWFSC